MLDSLQRKSCDGIGLVKEERPVGRTKRVWEKAVVVALAMTLAIQAFPVWGQSYDPAEELPKPTGFEKRLTKFARGLTNIAFSLAEIPMTLDRKLKEGKPLTYLIGVAPWLGLGRAFLRTSTGVFEVWTFCYSDRDVNFEAIIEPEYIF